jgi:hypothetical protein
VDVAILLTPSDDVKAYWRALNYRGSIVVVDSPECGSLMHAHKVERERPFSTYMAHMRHFWPLLRYFPLDLT